MFIRYTRVLTYNFNAFHNDLLQIFISVSPNFDCVVLFFQNFTNLKNLRFCLEILFPDYRLDFQAVKKTACYFPFDIMNAITTQLILI